jgi:RNA polymerase sigma factor (sigma-70 family)
MPGSLASMEACIPALRRYASALLRGRQDADDLVHDCLVRALERLHTRREDVEIRVWLFAIMHNLFISQLRRAKIRRKVEPLDDSNEPELGLRANQEDALHWRDMMRGLNALPEEQRAVLLLVSVENLSYAEVARVLGIPIGTVMSRLSRARERLRQYTGQESRPALRRVQ